MAAFLHFKTGFRPIISFLKWIFIKIHRVSSIPRQAKFRISKKVNLIFLKKKLFSQIWEILLFLLWKSSLWIAVQLDQKLQAFPKECPVWRNANASEVKAEAASAQQKKPGRSMQRWIMAFWTRQRTDLKSPGSAKLETTQTEFRWPVEGRRVKRAEMIEAVAYAVLAWLSSPPSMHRRRAGRPTHPVLLHSPSRVPHTWKRTLTREGKHSHGIA